MKTGAGSENIIKTYFCLSEASGGHFFNKEENYEEIDVAFIMYLYGVWDVFFPFGMYKGSAGRWKR